MPVKRQSDSPLGLYTIAIAALFLAGFFLLVVFGAQSYRDTVSGQSANMDGRALLSYLHTAVKAGDASGAVRIVDDNELRIADGDTGYSLRIYLREGELVEEYTSDAAARDASNAQVIGRTDVFEIARWGEDVLVLSTDAGEVLIHLRSEGGVGA